MFIKDGYRWRSCTSKTTKIHHFVMFVMYCFITTVPVAFYWACSDDTVHYKYNGTVIFRGFRCATTSSKCVKFGVVFKITQISCENSAGYPNTETKMISIDDGPVSSPSLVKLDPRTLQNHSVKCPTPKIALRKRAKSSHFLTPPPVKINGGWARSLYQLHQTWWGYIGRSLIHKKFVSAFRYLAVFSNASGSNLSDVENVAKFCTFWPPHEN